MKNKEIIEDGPYLSDMRPNDTAIIYSVANGDLSKRLYDLGFVSGTRVECAASAPFGGPNAYLIRGSLIALRRSDAKAVKIGYISRGGKVKWA